MLLDHLKRQILKRRYGTHKAGALQGTQNVQAGFALILFLKKKRF
jgi:hypothetical protein